MVCRSLTESRHGRAVFVYLSLAVVCALLGVFSQVVVRDIV
jgi:hypothetical protein